MSDEKNVVVKNYFHGPPPEPDAWVKQMEWELASTVGIGEGPLPKPKLTLRQLLRDWWKQGRKL